MQSVRCGELRKEGDFSVLLFPSVHYVLRAERLLKEAGVSAEAIATPREFSADCGIALLLKKAETEEALRILKERKLAPEAVHPFGK